MGSLHEGKAKSLSVSTRLEEDNICFHFTCREVSVLKNINPHLVVKILGNCGSEKGNLEENIMFRISGSPPRQCCSEISFHCCGYLEPIWGAS